MTNSQFVGSVVLVAGGTGALGRAVVDAFLAKGATVIVTWRQAQEFEAMRATSGANAARLEGRSVDVTDERAVTAMVADIVAQHQRLDVLVNAVGGYHGGTHLWEGAGNVLDRMLALNLRTGYTLARAAVPVMLRAHGGAIVNVAAKAGIDPPAGAAAYAASKAAALALMESLAAELTGTGVRVNSVLPSTIDTPANREAMPNANYAKWPKPVEIAQAILFLCSDDAAVIHGASIPVYGNR